MPIPVSEMRTLRPGGKVAGEHLTSEPMLSATQRSRGLLAYGAASSPRPRKLLPSSWWPRPVRLSSLSHTAAWFPAFLDRPAPPHPTGPAEACPLLGPSLATLPLSGRFCLCQGPCAGIFLRFEMNDPIPDAASTPGRYNRSVTGASEERPQPSGFRPPPDARPCGHWGCSWDCSLSTCPGCSDGCRVRGSPPRPQRPPASEPGRGVSPTELHSIIQPHIPRRPGAAPASLCPPSSLCQGLSDPQRHFPWDLPG